ncbi:MAG: glycosyltransferase family 8 protein [Smithella sp.]
MNIVFATDSAYLQHLAVALSSLLENNSEMTVYIINSDISNHDWEKLKIIFDGTDSVLIDAKIDDTPVKNLVTHSYSKATYYKLFIPDIVKGSKALYLDNDIVVNQKVDGLYNTDVSDTFLAAVDNKDTYNHHDLEMKHSAKYFNAGVMLINLEYWRTCNIKEKVIEFVNRKPEVIRFPDQDGFNSVINGEWRELHPKYNLLSAHLIHAGDSTIKDAIDNPVIIHYTGFPKPDHFKNNHPYKHLYWKYLRSTPYKYIIPDGLNIVDILKWIVPQSIKKRIKNIL